MNTETRWSIKIVAFSVLFLVTFLISEAALRFQQLVGPLYDLEMKSVTLEGLDDVLNHKHIAGVSQLKFVGKEMYGKYDGFQFTTNYDSNGIRIYRTDAFSACKEPVKILFLGDSFMEGYDDDNTLPLQVAEALAGKGICVLPFNAGTSSYSPAIFVPQVRALIPLVKPNLIVIDVDETDLFDDNVRYKELIQRDKDGRNIGVRRSESNYVFNKAFLDIQKDPLYLSRLIRKIFHIKVRMPQIEREMVRKYYIKGFEVSESDEATAAIRYAREINFLKANLHELMDVIADLGPGSTKTLFIRHPHLQHLQPSSDGRVWNSLVAKAVEESAIRAGAGFYDAKPDLQKAFASSPEAYYWRSDMHFNFDGLKIYSSFVTRALIRNFHL